MSWWERAACKGQDPERFFGQAGGSVPPVIARFCARCPVRFDCMAEGVRQGDWDTVRGGMSARKRRNLRGVLVQIVKDEDRAGFDRLDGVTNAQARALRRPAPRPVVAAKPGDLDLDDLAGLARELMGRVVSEAGYAVESDDLPGMVLRLMQQIAADRDAA